MGRLTGGYGCFRKKITASGLAALLLLAGVQPPPAAAQSCQGWNTEKFFATATVDQVRSCLSAGENPNEPDTQGLTALHWAAWKTSDPAVIETLLDAGANPRASSIAGRTPWDYARTNGKIKGSVAYQRLWITSAKKADWARVQAVPHHRKTTVLLYQDKAPKGKEKIKGRFVSATDDSITLRLRDGQTRTVGKQAVHKVLTRRPFGKRKTGWFALAGSSVLLVLLTTRGTGGEPGEVLGISSFLIGTPTLIAFLVATKGSIYNIPPEHRMLLQGDQQSGDQDNASGKLEESESPNG